MRAVEFFIKPHDEDDVPACHAVWNLFGRLVIALGHERFPAFVRDAISVTEPAGRISLKEMPEHTTMAECGVFTVLSANLWHDFPRYRDLENRLSGFASLVEREKVDLILLQEVARTPAIKVDYWLGKRLGMAYVYTRANGSERIGFEEGLSIFSRFPFRRLPYLRHLGRKCNPFVRRLALGVDVETPCGEILAFSTHLALSRSQNAIQLRELHQWVDATSAGRCAVVGGDFNAPEYTHQIRHVRVFWEDTYRTVHQHGDSITHEIRWPWGGALVSHRLDYIFIQPGIPAWRVVDVCHVDAPSGPHSDHRAVLARLAPINAGGAYLAR